jgi:hypothetical protein
MKCSLCGSQRIHTSRFRRSDILHLFILQLPVRCRECLSRGYAGLSTVLSLRKTEKGRLRDERGPRKNGHSTAG